MGTINMELLHRIPFLALIILHSYFQNNLKIGWRREFFCLFFKGVRLGKLYCVMGIEWLGPLKGLGIGRPVISKIKGLGWVLSVLNRSFASNDHIQYSYNKFNNIHDGKIVH